MNIEEVLEDIKRHLDYVNATNQSSIRDNQIKVMYEEIERLKEHNIQLTKREEINCRIIKKYQNIIKEIRKWLQEDYEYSKNYEMCDNPRYYLDKFEEILEKEKKDD